MLLTMDWAPYFSLNKMTEIFCPVSFTACTLSPAECNYCTPEKEALAAVFVIDRLFPNFLLDHHLQIQSDQSSLITLLSKGFLGPPSEFRDGRRSSRSTISQLSIFQGWTMSLLIGSHTSTMTRQMICQQTPMISLCLRMINPQSSAWLLEFLSNDSLIELPWILTYIWSSDTSKMEGQPPRKGQGNAQESLSEEGGLLIQGNAICVLTKLRAKWSNCSIQTIQE